MDVIPVSLIDQQRPARNIRTRTFFIVEECLDEDVLKASLVRLIRNHWRKLGGRLVARRKDGRLEYHVPKSFDQNHVLFNWSAQEYGHTIDKIAPAIRSPVLDKGPQFLPPISTIDSWCRPSDWPYHRKDEPPNAPLLYVHLSLFTDATTIAISLPHLVADQMGLANIIKAWMGMIEGKEPPPFVGYEGDLLPGSDQSYSDYPRDEIFRKGRQRIFRTGEYYSVVLLPFVPDLVINSKEKPAILFLPLQLIRSLREKHSKTLSAKYSDFSKISDGDIITALLAKMSRIHKKTPRIVCISQAINLRGHVPELMAEKADGFIHNCLHSGTARMPIDSTTPISEIAYANRKAIDQGLDARDIELGVSISREMVRRGQTTHICEPFERSYFVSNWCLAWKDLDFSPAIKGEKPKLSKPKLLVLGQSGERGTPLRFSSLILSRTEEGYWVEFSASVRAMKRIEEYLSKDPCLENF